MQGKLLLRDGSEHHLKFRYLTILVATVLLLSIFTGCGEFGDESADKSGKSESTGDIDTTTGDEKQNDSYYPNQQNLPSRLGTHIPNFGLLHFRSFLKSLPIHHLHKVPKRNTNR